MKQKSCPKCFSVIYSLRAEKTHYFSSRFVFFKCDTVFPCVCSFTRAVARNATNRQRCAAEVTDGSFTGPAEVAFARRGAVPAELSAVLSASLPRGRAGVRSQRTRFVQRSSAAGDKPFPPQGSPNLAVVARWI